MTPILKVTFTLVGGMVLAPPPAPTSLTARLVPNGIEVQWEDRSTGEIGFLVQRKSSRGKFVWVGNAPANATSFIDRRVKAEQSYTYRVRALGRTGPSNWSNRAFIDPDAPEVERMDPTMGVSRGVLEWTPAPATLFTTSGTSIRIGWKEVPHAMEYRIYRTTRSGNYDFRYPLVTLPAVPGEEPFYEDKGLTKGRSYFYLVRAILPRNP